MSNIEPKYRRPLNSDQLKLLQYLCKYRFSSSQHIALYFNKPSGKYVQNRLKILEDQGLVAKRYDKSYKLKGQPAAYYLLPKAARLLKAQNPDNITDQGIKNRYKDKTASDSFINHCLNVCGSYLHLKTIYGADLKSFTSHDIRLNGFDNYPRWLPDVMMTLPGGAEDNGHIKRFFLDYFEATTPFFVLVRRVKSYLTYAESEDWGVDTPLPTILFITETPAIQKRLRKRIHKQLDEAWDEEAALFYTTTKDQLFQSHVSSEPIWQAATDPDSLVTLQSAEHVS